MLCMLLRKKKLQGATLETGSGTGTASAFDFDAVNELGRPCSTHHLDYGNYGAVANVILTDENGKIVDAGNGWMRRCPRSAWCCRESPISCRLPGKTLPAECFQLGGGSRCQGFAGRCGPLSKALLSVLQGVSPIVWGGIEHRVGRGKDLAVRQMDEEQYFRLGAVSAKLKGIRWKG